MEPESELRIATQALYAAEWEVRKAIGVCCDVGYEEGQKAAIEANLLLRVARRALLVRIERDNKT